MSTIPVKRELLVWARKFRSLSLAEASDRLNIDVEKLEALESGEELPSLTLFESIATKYRIPQATLFMTKPPEVSGLPDDFRTLEGRDPSHSFDFSVAFSAVDNFRRVLDIVSEEDEEFPDIYLPRYSMEVDPESMARQERERLGLSANVPLSWKSGESFNRWRALIEKQGIPVFILKFPLDDCRGFTLNRPGSNPIIVINKSEPFKVARTFTLMHEYCHLLLGKPGLSDLDNRNEVEAYCNKFAAAFLMPHETLRMLIKNWPNSPVDWEDRQISHWASRLKVSRIALALRLEGIGLAPSGFSRRFHWHSGYTPRKQSSGGDGIATTLSELGNAYTGAVFDAYKRGAISKTNAEEYLSIRGKHFETVEGYVEKHKVLARE